MSQERKQPAFCCGGGEGGQGDFAALLFDFDFDFDFDFELTTQVSTKGGNDLQFVEEVGEEPESCCSQ